MQYVKSQYVWTPADVVQTTKDGDRLVDSTSYTRMHPGMMYITCFVIFDKMNAQWAYRICASENPMNMPTIVVISGEGHDTEFAAMAECDAAAAANRISNHLVLSYALQ